LILIPIVAGNGVKRPGLRSRSRKESFLGGVGVRFLTTLEVGGGFFCPTPDVQLDHFFTSHS